MRVQPRDLDILMVGVGGSFEQAQVEWVASYQAKMRRLRKLCSVGLLEVRMIDRKKPNLYTITEKGRKLLQKRQKSFLWNKGVAHETR